MPGLASNNPGNLRYDGTPWIGLDDPPEDALGFCRFKSMQLGLRAMGKVLLTYYDRHNLQCVEDIIQRWAPPGENDTDAYVTDVCARLHVRPEELIDVHLPATMQALISAIGHHETGVFPAADILIAAVADLPLSGTPKSAIV